MKSIKVMLFGIAIILLSIFGILAANFGALYNFMATVCPFIGLLIVIVAVFIPTDN